MSASTLAVGVTPDQTVLPRRHPWRLVSGAVVLVLMAWGLDRVMRTKAFEWNIFASYFFSGDVLDGLWTTIWLTGAVMGLSLVLGVVVAAMRLSGNPVMQSIAWVYVWIFRSAPLLVQLLLWFNIGYLYPRLSIGIPWGPSFADAGTVDLISATSAALLGLTMHTVAYASEIIRGGIISVPTGQTEAAQVLGLHPMRVFARIVLPQSMRSIVPSLGNLLVDLLKSTSIVSVLAVPDLLYSVQKIYNSNYRIMPLLMVATVWYILVTSVLSVGQYYIERYYARGSRTLLPTPLQKLRAMVRPPVVAADTATPLDASHGRDS